MPKPFEARVSKALTLLLILGGVLLIAACLYILLAPRALEGYRRSGPVLYIAAGVGVPFFGLCLIISLRMLLSSAVQVRIDSRGVYWKRWSETPIPWKAIAEGWTFKVANQPSLCLRLHDPSRYPAKSRALRFASRANQKMGTGDVAISMSGLDKSHDELMAAFQEWQATPGRP